MRAVDSSEESTSDSDDNPDFLEMFSNPKSTAPDGKRNNVDDHTEEYWKSNGHQVGSSNEKTKNYWVNEVEALNKRHRASDSFSVLNELVVVRVPFSSNKS